VLADGTKHDFAYAMIVPPFLGQEVVARTPGLADAKGFVRVRDTYQSEAYDDVYAIGAAAAVEVPWQTPVAVGIPKTGFPAERMAHVAAGTSPPRSVARSRPMPRRSATCRRSASWTPATTA